MTFLRTLRYNWEAIQNSWNQWVLSYSQERQRALVERLGLAPTLENVALVLAFVMAALLGWLAFVSLRPRPCATRSARRTYSCASDWSGPESPRRCRAARANCTARTRRALIDEDVRTARKLLSRYERLRYGPASASATRTDVRALRRAIQAFKPRPNPL